MSAAKRSLRALMRRSRNAIRLAGVALDRRHELGVGGLARWAAARALSGIRPQAASLPQMPPPGAVFDAIYAIGYWDGEPKRYRVFNPVEGLRAAGYAVHVMAFDRLEDIVRFGWRARALVLFRAEYDRLAGVAEVLAYAGAIGMRVVYDIDDLVFDPGIADRIDGLRAMGPHQRRHFVAALARRRRLLLESDGMTASTAPLARAAAAFGKPSAVVPNALNDAQLRLAAEIAAMPRQADAIVRVGYFSGSPTHQRDFAACEAALFEAMMRHPHLRFRLVGPLDLGSDWQRFTDRIERIGLLPPDDLLRSIAETDINLAPLELGNPFAEAKSELKFFEAAAVGVPTVASATEPFAAAIEDGVSGLLARDMAEWGAAFDLLVGSAARRHQLGAAARERVLARHSVAAVTPRAVAALGLDARPANADPAFLPAAVAGAA